MAAERAVMMKKKKEAQDSKTGKGVSEGDDFILSSKTAFSLRRAFQRQILSCTDSMRHAPLMVAACILSALLCPYYT